MHWLFSFLSLIVGFNQPISAWQLSLSGKVGQTLAIDGDVTQDLRLSNLGDEPLVVNMSSGPFSETHVLMPVESKSLRVVGSRGKVLTKVYVTIRSL